MNDNNKFSVQDLLLILPEDGLCGWLIFVFLWTSEITILVGLFPFSLVCVCWHSILFVLDKVSHWLVWASSMGKTHWPASPWDSLVFPALGLTAQTTMLSFFSGC